MSETMALALIGGIAGVTAAGFLLHGRAKRFASWVLYGAYFVLFPAVAFQVCGTIDEHGSTFRNHPLLTLFVATLAGVLSMIACGWPIRLYFAWKKRGDDLASVLDRIRHLETQVQGSAA